MTARPAGGRAAALDHARTLPAYTRRSRLEPAGVPPKEIHVALGFLEAQIGYALHGTEYGEMVRRYRAGEGSRWREVLGMDAQNPNPPEAPAWEVFREFLSADLHAPHARDLLEGGNSPSFGPRRTRSSPSAT